MGANLFSRSYLKSNIFRYPLQGNMTDMPVARNLLLIYGPMLSIICNNAGHSMLDPEIKNKLLP